jgi:hypothetical protein
MSEAPKRRTAGPRALDGSRACLSATGCSAGSFDEGGKTYAADLPISLGRSCAHQLRLGRKRSTGPRGAGDMRRPQDYRAFVEKSHRRVHPDRWNARRFLLAAVGHAGDTCVMLEVASNGCTGIDTPAA